MRVSLVVESNGSEIGNLDLLAKPAEGETVTIVTSPQERREFRVMWVEHVVYDDASFIRAHVCKIGGVV